MTTDPRLDVTLTKNHRRTHEGKGFQTVSMDILTARENGHCKIMKPFRTSE